MYFNPGTSWTIHSARHPRVEVFERPENDPSFATRECARSVRPTCRSVWVFAPLTVALCFLGMQAGKAQSPTFGANAQHTANYLVAAQHLNSVRWSTPVDLDNGGAFAH